MRGRREAALARRPGRRLAALTAGIAALLAGCSSYEVVEVALPSLGSSGWLLLALSPYQDSPRRVWSYDLSREQLQALPSIAPFEGEVQLAAAVYERPPFPGLEHGGVLPEAPSPLEPEDLPVPPPQRAFEGLARAGEPFDWSPPGAGALPAGLEGFALERPNPCGEYALGYQRLDLDVVFALPFDGQAALLHARDDALGAGLFLASREGVAMLEGTEGLEYERGARLEDGSYWLMSAGGALSQLRLERGEQGGLTAQLEPRAPHPRGARPRHLSTWDGGQLFMVSTTGDVDRYDVAADRWQALGSGVVPNELRMSVAALGPGELLVASAASDVVPRYRDGRWFEAPAPDPIERVAFLMRDPEGGAIAVTSGTGKTYRFSGGVWDPSLRPGQPQALTNTAPWAVGRHPDGFLVGGAFGALLHFSGSRGACPASSFPSSQLAYTRVAAAGLDLVVFGTPSISGSGLEPTFSYVQRVGDAPR